MNPEKLITDTLISMKQDAFIVSKNPSDIMLKTLMHKYDTVFTGKQFNKVLSIEVANFLNMDSTLFNQHIGKVAQNLHMGLEGLHQVSSTNPDSTDAYYINLF